MNSGMFFDNFTFDIVCNVSFAKNDYTVKFQTVYQ